MTTRGAGRQANSRQVGDGEKGIGVEDVRLEEPLEQIPRHWITRCRRRRAAAAAASDGVGGASSSWTWGERLETGSFAWRCVVQVRGEVVWDRGRGSRIGGDSEQLPGRKDADGQQPQWDALQPLGRGMSNHWILERARNDGEMRPDRLMTAVGELFVGSLGKR